MCFKAIGTLTHSRCQIPHFLRVWFAELVNGIIIMPACGLQAGFVNAPRGADQADPACFAAATPEFRVAAFPSTAARRGRLGRGAILRGASLVPLSSNAASLRQRSAERSHASRREGSGVPLALLSAVPATPHASLIEVKGALYGTTVTGGSGPDCSGGCGTVFAIDPKTGKEKVTYSFCSVGYCLDGAFPYAALIEVSDTHFGTTMNGGANGGGTVFSIVS